MVERAGRGGGAAERRGRKAAEHRHRLHRGTYGEARVGNASRLPLLIMSAAASAAAAQLVLALGKRPQPQRALEEHLKRAGGPERADLVDQSSFVKALCSLVPAISPVGARALFERHAQPGCFPRAVSANAFAAKLLPKTEVPAAQAPVEPPRRPKQAWEVADAKTGSVSTATSSGGLSDRRAKAAAASRPASAPEGDNAQLALAQLGRALGQEAAARAVSGTAPLPRAERLTMHSRQADAAEKQLLLLRRLRAVEPLAPALTEAQLAEALRPLGESFARAERTHRAAFLERAFTRAVWQRSERGAIQRLLDLLCPVPLARATIAAAGGAAAMEPEKPIEGHAGGPVLNGPFDRGNGKPGTQRRGARLVRPPAELPRMVKYRHCRTPLLVPPDFEGAEITRSAQQPQYSLELARVHGYNGLGKHNRSPNLFALPDGRILFCTAGVAILEDLRTGEQSFYGGHDDDIVCVALHPGGELVATGQGTTAGGAAARLSVWDIKSLREVARVGRVLDEKVGDGVTTRPFYTGSLCAAAFGPDGRLLVAVGKDEQHMVGVWDWRKGELMAKAPGMVVRPLGVHQLAIAPTPLAVDAQGRTTLFFTLVGVTNAPKFGTLAPVAAPGPTRWELTFTLGKLNLKPGKPPPPSMSAVAYGGASFPSPSGAKHGLTFVSGGYGSIYVFDAPRNTTALRVVAAHEGPISVLCTAGGALASGGEDGIVHLWASADAGGLERIHTYAFRAVDDGRNPAARPVSATSSDPNSVSQLKKPAAKTKQLEPVSAATTTRSLPTATNGGVGAIRSLALLPVGAKRAVAGNRHVQIPTLLAGTARCSLWRLEPQGGVEIAVGHFGEATGVAAHPTKRDTWASCGADQQLLLWQSSSRLPVHRVLLAKPGRCVEYAADGSLVAVGCADGGICVVRPAEHPGASRRGVPVPTQPTGVSGAIEVLSFAPGSGMHGGLLAIGSHDRTIRVLQLVLEGSRLKVVPVCCCTGHTSTVTHLDWSADSSMLMTNCAAHEILVWSASSGKKLAHAARALATVAWATWTCYLGFPCMGIWPEGADATHINSCHVSGDHSVLLTADDKGSLKLFNAPCVVEGAPYVEGSGHCSGITSARILSGPVAAAVSSGGADRAVMLWPIVRGSGGRQAVANLPEQARRDCWVNAPLKAID